MSTQVWPEHRVPDGGYGPPAWSVLLRALVTCLALTAVTGGAAFLAEYLGEERWMARAEVEYRGDLLAETVAVTMSSPGIWGPIASDHGIPIKEFNEHYSAEVVGGTQAIQVQYADTDPARARRIVAEIVDAYITQYTIVDDSVPNAILEDYLEALRSTEAEMVAVLESNRDVLTRSEQIDRQDQLVTVRQAITQVLLRLDGRATELDRMALQQPRIISEPYLLPEPVEPRPLRMAVFGAMGGLALSGAVAFLLFHRDEQQRLNDALATGVEPIGPEPVLVIDEDHAEGARLAEVVDIQEGSR